MNWPRRLQQTDQTRCYGQNGLEVPFADSGQNASRQKSGNSYLRGCFRMTGSVVADTFTKAVWSKDANPAEFPLSWQEALLMVVAFNRKKAGGRNDWRMPTIREVESLVDISSHSPDLPAGHPFVEVIDAYWSSTTSV